MTRNQRRAGGGPWTVRVACALVLAALPVGAATGIDALQPELERIRGLRFLRPVEVTEIRRADLRGVLERELVRDLDLPPEQYFEMLRDLNLIDDPADPMSELLDLYEGQVLAFYDPVNHVYYSIADPSGPMLGSPILERAVALHELMHAMQDQRFHAGERLEAMRGDWDAEMAYHALIEGEATLVMLAALVDSSGGSLDDFLSNDQMMSAFDRAAALDLGKVGAPPYFTASLKFPYVEGLRFAIEAYRRGGWPELDRANEDPPRTTEEVFDPSRYFERTDERQAPSLPAWGLSAGAGFETKLGEFHWRFLLGSAAPTGWNGDLVTVMDLLGVRRVLVESDWSSSCSAEEFARSYAAFLSTRVRDVRVLVDGGRVCVVYSVAREAQSETGGSTATRIRGGAPDDRP